MDSFISRCAFLKYLGGVVLTLPHLRLFAAAMMKEGQWVNDGHTQLSKTRVRYIVDIQAKNDALNHIKCFDFQDKGIAIAGARHSAGGQQFLTDGLLFDNRKLNKVLGYNVEKQLIEVESGCTWPQIMDFLHSRNASLSIRQKPTGNDEITIGGSLSTNIHGRGLAFPPIISDVESIRLLNGSGTEIECSRKQNSEILRA